MNVYKPNNGAIIDRSEGEKKQQYKNNKGFQHPTFNNG